MCVYHKFVYEPVSVLNCVWMFKTFWNIQEKHQLALKIAKRMKEHLKSKHTTSKRYTVRDQGGMQKRCEDEWEQCVLVDEAMLTYSWLMTLVVFTKGHEANSDGLKTWSDGRRKLERESHITKKQKKVTYILILHQYKREAEEDCLDSGIVYVYPFRINFNTLTLTRITDSIFFALGYEPRY